MQRVPEGFEVDALDCLHIDVTFERDALLLQGGFIEEY